MMKTSELKTILDTNGCYFVRNGKHEIWYSPITNRNFPVPHHKTVTRNTARNIFLQAGIIYRF